MPFGMQVIDPSTGFALIDTQYMRYGLLQSGLMDVDSQDLVTAGFTIGAEAGAAYSFRVSGAICPVVFIEGAGVIYTSVKVGDDWIFVCCGWPKTMVVASDIFRAPGQGLANPLGHGPRYYVFDLMKKNKERIGLEVLHPDTQETLFNSNQWPLNVVASKEPPQMGPGGAPYQIDSSGEWWGVAPSGNWSNSVSGGWNGHSQYVGITWDSLGLQQNRRYAAFNPWTRGALCSGQADDYAVIEAVGCYGGVLSWGWCGDPMTQYGFETGSGQGVYKPNPNRSRAVLIDVTNLPLGYRY